MSDGAPSEKPDRPPLPRDAFRAQRVGPAPAQKPVLQPVVVTPSSHQKCERCWHYREDVGADADHPTLYGRCVSNLFGSGEHRSAA